MSLWSLIVNKLREVLGKMIGSKTIQDELRIAPIISTEMERAISLWSQMYKDKAPWLHNPTKENPARVVSLGLPAMIASEKARMVLLELQTEITTPTEEVMVDNPDYVEPEPDMFGNILPPAQPMQKKEDVPVTDTSRAEFLNKMYDKLKIHLRRQLEYGIAKGGFVIKPYIVYNKLDEDVKVTDDANTAPVSPTIEFDFIQADAFYPLSFDGSGNIVEAAFIQSKTDKEFVYRRLEYHKWQGNAVTVINKAYKSKIPQNAQDGRYVTITDLGKEIPLSEVVEWKDLPENTKIAPIDKPLFAYFKMPEANTIDTTSPLGVSGFSRAVRLIKDADMQYSRLLWEYEAGEMAIDIDRDALNFLTDPDGTGQGHTELSHLQNRLFRKVDLNDSDTYQPYAPSLRDAQYIEGLNVILMRIEDVCGISRGTLSDAASEARTATELKILKQRSYQTNCDIQKALEHTLKDVIYIMNAYCDLYEITPDGEYDVSFNWDDSILNDEDEELNKKLTLMQNGLLGKVEVRMWVMGETRRQAEDAMIQIQEESRKAIEQNMVMSSAMGKEFNDYEDDDTQPNNKSNQDSNLEKDTMNNSKQPNNKQDEEDDSKKKKGNNVANKKE